MAGAVKFPRASLGVVCNNFYHQAKCVNKKGQVLLTLLALNQSVSTRVILFGKKKTVVFEAYAFLPAHSYSLQGAIHLFMLQQAICRYGERTVHIWRLLTAL